MPLPRFENLPRAKRRAILSAAAAEFAEKGFDGASFNRIIETAEISKGAMYYYFADKADVYGAVLGDVLDRVHAELTEVEMPADAAGYWLALESGLGRLNATFFADEQLARLFRGLYGGSPDNPTFQLLLGQTRRWVDQLLELGQHLGAVRSDLPRDLLAEGVTGLLISMDRWFAERLSTKPLRELLPLASKVLELVRDLLEPKNGAKPRKETVR
jgi:AcrR family transcriptional regulator